MHSAFTWLRNQKRTGGNYMTLTTFFAVVGLIGLVAFIGTIIYFHHKDMMLKGNWWWKQWVNHAKKEYPPRHPKQGLPRRYSICKVYSYSFSMSKTTRKRLFFRLVTYQVVHIDDVAGGLLYYVAQSFLLAGSIFGLDQYIRVIKRNYQKQNNIRGR